MTKHFFEYFNEIFPARWNEPALTDYNGDVSYSFSDVAAQVQRIGNYFRTVGIQPGDKIAICGRNCTNWAVAYLAIASYGGIIVSILPFLLYKRLEPVLFRRRSSGKAGADA